MKRKRIILVLGMMYGMFGLSAAMTLIPIIMFIVSYILIKKKYIIDEDFYEKITKEIAQRKKLEVKND
jgi:Na+/melibiose symporter-like transporter